MSHYFLGPKSTDRVKSLNNIVTASNLHIFDLIDNETGLMLTDCFCPRTSNRYLLERKNPFADSSKEVNLNTFCGDVIHSVRFLKDRNEELEKKVASYDEKIKMMEDNMRALRVEFMGISSKPLEITKPSPMVD